MLMEGILTWWKNALYIFIGQKDTVTEKCKTYLPLLLPGGMLTFYFFKLALLKIAA